MKVLIVGGTGLIGGDAALYLRDQGMQVTIMSRSKPSTDVLADFDHIVGSYRDNAIERTVLAQFDAVVFAAGADLRQLPADCTDMDAFFHAANVEDIPAFINSVKAAGVKHAVYVGSYYPQVVPDQIEANGYVRSRHLSDAAVRSLNDDSFNVCTLNAPFVLGVLPGLDIPHLQGLVAYAAGQLPDIPLVAPGGGVNHISARSLSQAIFTALQNGKGGHDYLVGDENLSWKAYLEIFCEVVGNPQDLAVSEEEHPLFPDIMMYAGRNATVSYEGEQAEISYQTGQITQTIRDVVAALS